MEKRVTVSHDGIKNIEVSECKKNSRRTKKEITHTAYLHTLTHNSVNSREIEMSLYLPIKNHQLDKISLARNKKLHRRNNL